MRGTVKHWPWASPPFVEINKWDQGACETPRQYVERLKSNIPQEKTLMVQSVINGSEIFYIWRIYHQSFWQTRVFLFHIEYLHSNRAATKAKHISLSVWLTSLNHGRLELPAEPLLNATNHGRLWNLTWRENYRISYNFGAASLSPIWGHRRLVEFREKLAKRASLAIKCQVHVSWSVSLRCWACKLTRLPFALWNILKPTTEVVRENTS